MYFLYEQNYTVYKVKKQAMNVIFVIIICEWRRNVGDKQYLKSNGRVSITTQKDAILSA